MLSFIPFCGQRYAVCCNSGTDALTLAAIALDLKTATIQSNTLPLTGIGLHRAGTEVRIADIDSHGALDGSIQDAVPVLMFGQLPAPDQQTAKLYDAAHAHSRQITSRIDEIQAAVLRVKLKYLDTWLAERKVIGEHYNRRLMPLKLTLNNLSLYHLYVIRLKDRGRHKTHIRQQKSGAIAC